MLRAICIKDSDNFQKGEIVKAVQGFGPGIHYYKGCRFNLNASREEFEKHFMPFKNSYSIEKPPKQRYFRRPKRCFMNVVFRDISDEHLVILYNCIFSYVELVRQMSPDLIQTFNYSIVSTIEKLEYLYYQLPIQSFIEAVQDSEDVFIGIYKTATSIEREIIPKIQNHDEILESFKQENAILKNFYEELNSNFKHEK